MITPLSSSLTSLSQFSSTFFFKVSKTVSYTHLTLPTTERV